jgi:zinc/manganese transport system permease protein
MNTDALFDPLFLLPFVNGALLSVLLPVFGAYARLRGEWLASLGIAQMAAAGVVIGLYFGHAALAVALGVALLAAVAKTLIARGGNDAYAVMILAGWSVALLAAANTAHGDELGRALIQGQIYFTGLAELARLAALALVTAGCLPMISRRLMLGRFFPAHFVANGTSTPGHDLAFDVLFAGALAFAATTVGVMGAFALVFIAPWVAFRFAGGWRRALVWSAGIGVGAYAASFALAILLDQPFGPVLVVALLFAAASRLLPKR